MIVTLGWADLVELTALGHFSVPRSAFGVHPRPHLSGSRSSNEGWLVYWLGDLIFPGAWLDQRVERNLREVAWDYESSDFG
jgi:hypothetical protein